MSRNDNRFQENLDTLGQIPQPQQEPENNVVDLLTFAAPTEFVQLPSKGKFYPPGHPLCNSEFVEIKYMTAKEEDILTSQALIKKGVVLDRLIQSVLIDKRIKPESLLVGDKTALMIASRITGFGPEYATKFFCRSCNESVHYTFDLSELKEPEQVNFEEEGITDEGEGLFSVILPKTKIKATLRLLTGQDEIEIGKFMEKQKKSNVDLGASTTQLLFIIHALNDQTGRAQIYNFIQNLPFSDAKFIREVYKKVNPTVNMKQETVCPNCGAEEEVELPMTVEFFWPKQ